MQLFFSDQIPFVTARGVNWTALDFQTAQRERMAELYTIRRQAFMERSVKIVEFAKPERQVARVRIESPGGRSDIFAKFETDRAKDPLGGSIAVPTEHVPRTPTGVIKAAWRPRRVLDRNFQGDFRAFVKKSGKGRAIYFQEHDGKILPLYWLVPRVKIEPDLRFVKTAERTVNERWRANFTRSFDRAIGLGSRRA